MPHPFNVLPALALLLPLAAVAAQQPDAKSIADTLYGPPRSIDGENVGRGIKVPEPERSERAIDLNITFEFGSARLTDEGKVLAGNLGRALRDRRLINHRFRIEGHTDAVGSDDYNMKLSTRRAVAVRDYLVDHYQADPDQLETIGFGKTRLRDPSEPNSPLNRRVRIVDISDQIIRRK